MFRREKRLAFIAWIALCAILMAAVAPGVSRLLSAAVSSCHAAVSPSTGHHESLALDDACGYCKMQGELPFVPPVAPAAQHIVPLPLALASPTYLAPAPQTIWLGALSRAPPFLL